MQKWKEIIQKNYKWLVLFICVVLFFTLLKELFKTEQMKMDTIVYQIVVENMRTEPLTTILKMITNLGSAYALIGIAGICVLLLKNKRIGISININLILSGGLNFLLKNIIERPRPEGYRLISETGFSFPSGHSMVSTAFYGFLIYLIWKKVKNKTIRNISCLLLGILIPLIGFSRIYLGVHYASDVMAGFVIAIAYLILFTTLTKSILTLQEKEGKGEINDESEQK